MTSTVVSDVVLRDDDFESHVAGLLIDMDNLVAA
jgi:hypothetical protein